MLPLFCDSRLLAVYLFVVILFYLGQLPTKLLLLVLEKLHWIGVAKLNIFTPVIGGYAVVQFVEAFRYKPQGRGFDSRCGHWYFSLA
jgi:hypothetical protein